MLLALTGRTFTNTGSNGPDHERTARSTTRGVCFTIWMGVATLPDANPFIRALCADQGTRLPRPNFAASAARQSCQFWARHPTVKSADPRKPLGTAWAQSGHRMGTKQNAALVGRRIFSSKLLFLLDILWLRGQDLNLRPLGYEPNELPGCSTPRLSLQLYPRFAACATTNIIPSCHPLRRLQVHFGRRVRRTPSERCHPRENPSSGFAYSHPGAPGSAGRAR